MKKYINEITGATAWLRDGAQIPYGFTEVKPARKPAAKKAAPKKAAAKKPAAEETETE